MNSIPTNSESGYSGNERSATRQADADLRADEMHEARAILAAQKGTLRATVLQPAPVTSPFNFGDHPVRVVVRDGQPWFVAADVCAALDYKNASKAVADHLDPDERSNEQLDRSRMGSKAVIINESGLYALVLRSRKPEARKFAKWVTSEVLPQIRKTGAYLPKEFAVNPGDILTKEQQAALRQLVKTTTDRLPKAKQGLASIKMWSKLKAHFGVAYREIPQAEFTEAVSLLTRAATEWELVDDAADEVAARAERQKKASSVAAEVGAAAYRTVFKAVMDSDEDIESNRWVFGLRHSNYGRSDDQDEPWAQVVPRNACIASLRDIAKMINEPNGMMPEQGDLIALLLACATRIREGLPANLRI